jgi:hypothetical protein
MMSVASGLAVAQFTHEFISRKCVRRYGAVFDSIFVSCHTG